MCHLGPELVQALPQLALADALLGQELGSRIDWRPQGLEGCGNELSGGVNEGDPVLQAGLQ